MPSSRPRHLTEPDGQATPVIAQSGGGPRWTATPAAQAHSNPCGAIVPYSEESDRSLLERAQREPAAFGALFERHFDAVFGYIVRRTRDWDAARDLTSEVFLKALKNAWRFKWRGVAVSAWLFAIANNELRMYFRRGKRAPVSLDALVADSSFVPVDPGTLEAEREEAEAEIERAQAFTRVQNALIRLPKRYQEVIALRFFEKKSIIEISEILGKPEGTVKSLLSRGLQRLRGLLG